MPKTILVTGSRNWMSPRQIESLLREEWEEGCRVIHGGANGADTIADGVARRLGMEVEIFYPNWSSQGRKAGFLRNQKMVEQKPDVVLAFQVQRSTGTQHTIDLAKAAGIPVRGWRMDYFEE